jgi:ribose transport system permease protein
VLAISLQTQLGFSWPVAVLIVLALGCFLGLVNGLLVEMAQIDSFIATLGTGTVLYALALWYTEGRQIIGSLPRASPPSTPSASSPSRSPPTTS